jgi:cyclase
MSGLRQLTEEGLFLRLGPHCLTRISDRGCNPGLVVTKEGAVFIDSPQRPSDALAWIEAAAALGLPLVLVNTEHHLDHVAGNSFFDVPIIGHVGTRQRFHDVSPIWGTSVEDVPAMFARIDPVGASKIGPYRVRPPQITFDDRLVLDFGVEIVLINLPGHVPNSTVVHIPADGVVFMSDNLFCDALPWLHEADPLRWIEALREVRSWNAEVIVPGHGPVCGPDALETFEAFLADVVSAVGAAIDRGWSAAETAERLDFLDRWPIPGHLEAMAPVIQKAGLQQTHAVLTAR